VKIKMDIPIETVGLAPGIKSGGKLVKKLRYITVKSLPKNMPSTIEIDVSNLGLGKSFKVGELVSDDYEILNSPLVTIVGIEIPRALRGKSTSELEAEGEEEGD
jgi:large subunit ribosomal protein L25